MNIKILSRTKILDICGANPNKFDTITIVESVLNLYDSNRIEQIQWLSKSNLTLTFDDVTSALKYGTIEYMLAKKEDVVAAIEFARDKDELLVACAAGVSRSSAIAYIMLRTKHSVEDSIAQLNFNKHWPNNHILKLGEDIIGLPLRMEIGEYFNDYKNTYSVCEA